MKKKRDLRTDRLDALGLSGLLKPEVILGVSTTFLNGKYILVSFDFMQC